LVFGILIILVVLLRPTVNIIDLIVEIPILRLRHQLP
jgi:hypothetical protein